MRFKYATILIIVVQLALSACSSKSSDNPYLNDPLPTTTFYTIDGEQVSSSSLLGKPTVVAFWAEWCPASRSRMPGYAEFVRESGLGRRVNFVAVGLDEEQDYQRYLDFIQKAELSHLRHFFSGNGGADLAMHSWRVERLPHFFLINTQGVLAAESHSFGDIEDVLEDHFSQH